MATKIRKQTDSKKIARFKRKARIRSNVVGDKERPRLSFFRSNANLYVQVINDVTGSTLVSASTLDDELKGRKKNIDGAKALGQLIAKRAIAKSIDRVVFDRGGYIYHGRVKALADAARESGLKF